ncbi:hypothetical protein QO010_002929 [Caulobacter ginsengisoli]|uniref:Tail specific protease domain-containing protein n=1 Tax=Caulobacter ginsengisoli TaxID=400775 RepID=A0ABU0IT22_9CAUL|nr:S41 family peptidase [Caulobacter ginsengisoli]MDQ0465145.1 hypothetical protein [Caulobacter ginsengisoli]
MTRNTLLAGAALLLALTGAAVAQTAPPQGPMAAAPAAPVQPRLVVDGVAQAISDSYFDAAKGAQIAASLGAAAAKGEFDRFTDPRDLATALGNWLRPLDAHFNVVWNPAAGPPPQGGPQRRAPDPAQIAQREAADRRANFGFRRVEILSGNIGYIDLRQFADFDPESATAPARDAADAALALIARTDAVIIDLRDNGGGSPAMVGYLASAFTPAGANIYNTFHSREGDSSEAPIKPYAKPRLDVPVYILTTARTGSAAEALAYTLQQAGRATIVGEASGGAANPGGMAPAGNGFAIFVSRGSPENPISHKNWEGTGVQPDQPAPAAQALIVARRLALTAVVAKAPAGPARTDSQWALEALDAEGRPPVAPAADLAGTYSGVNVTVNGEGLLQLQRGRRPPQVLLALGGDLFNVRGEPDRRLRFARDDKGRPVALEYLTEDGSPGPRLRRD